MIKRIQIYPPNKDLYNQQYVSFISVMPRKETRFPTVPEVHLKARRVIQQKNLTKNYNRKPKPKTTMIFHHAEDYLKQKRAVGRSKVHQKKVIKNFHSLKNIQTTTGAVAVVILYQRCLLPSSLFICFIILYIP